MGSSESQTGWFVIVPKTLRVLIITPEYPPDHGGGIITYYRELVPALVSEGCQVTVLKGSSYTHGKPDEVINGVPVKHLETRRFENWLVHLAGLGMFPQLRSHLAAAFALHEQAKQGDGFDVVEVVDWGMQFLPWTISTQAPFVIQLHGSDGQIALKDPVVGREAEGLMSFLLEKSGMPYGAALSGYSHANVKWWEKMLNCGVGYLPPPLQPSEVKARASSPRAGWISFGRIQHWKGPQVACEAWRILGKKAPELDWYGRRMTHGESGRPLSEWLKGSFPEVWEKKIVHHKTVSPSEVSNRMAKAKVVLVPSLWDTFNYVTVEAMAHGCVVLVSDGAGAADLIEHGKNGFVFPAENAEALAALVEEIEGLPEEKIKSIGREASMTVTRSMDPASVAKKKIELYKTTKLPVERCEWLKKALLPLKNEHQRKDLQFLDGLPLQGLARYVMKRTISKILRPSF